MEIAGSSQTTISLNEILSESGSEFGNGSVRIDYLGEEHLLDAWAVVQTGSQATTVPFADPGKIQSTRAQSFWDTRSFEKRGGIEPVYVLLNTRDSVLEYSATATTSEEGSETTYHGKLQPQAVELLSTGLGNDAAGSITFEHDGLPGDLISIGLLQGESYLNPLPVFDPETPLSTEYHSVTMPLRSRDSLGNPVSMRVLVSAFNSTQEHREASVVVFDPTTGEELTRHEGILEPGGVNTLDIAELLAAANIVVDADDIRVAVTHSGEPGSVLPSARSVGWLSNCFSVI